MFDLSWMAEFLTKLSLVTLKKFATGSSKFLNNFISKAFLLNDGCNTIYRTICWPLGHTVKLRSQNRKSCKTHAYIWPWLVLSLADVIESLEF